jgi:hypothetical protein
MVSTKFTNVKLKPHLRLTPMPLLIMASTIPELPDTPEQPLHTLTDPSKELLISPTEDIMADITVTDTDMDTHISDKKLY